MKNLKNIKKWTTTNKKRLEEGGPMIGMDAKTKDIKPQTTEKFGIGKEDHS